MSASASLPRGDAESIEAFRRLLESASGPARPESPVLLTDRLVGAEAGELLRRCAVPHEFDSALLACIGELDKADAEERYAQFTDLSLMQIGEHSLSIHERWRQPLWRWWLEDAQRAQFVALSERLVQWFTRPASETGEDPAARRRMFHLIGWRHDEGMQAFDQLFRTARHRRRFSECMLLLRLVREYEPVLSNEERALLAYHEGKINIDMRQWERALPILRTVADDAQASMRLRVNAQVRMGHALRQLGRTDEALALLEGVLARSVNQPAVARSRWRVLYELGEIYRDLGRVDAAAATLSEALATTNDDEEEADVAGVLNSLGTVQLKLRDIDGAIRSFESSLEQLQRRRDALRPGTVLNNLGLAQLERCDWPAAEAAFASSLEIKRGAGDVLGQATTLLNLSRAQAAQERTEEAQQSAQQAAALFEQGSDARGQNFARQTLARLQQRGGHANAPPRGKGLPWWAWTLIGLGVLLFLFIAIAES